ncbi:MAG: MlaD family protein [Parvularculaceae bacterium]|nr:MlaD family protein [Parvularculaceae bacterium]
METRAHYVVVGAVVLALVASAFLFVLFLSQSRDDFDEYDIIFRERVSGLSVGAAVSFNGIQKGEVRDLTIALDDPSIVIARIRIDDDTPVKTDTKAELELVGFTGLAIIQLVGGSAEEELLKNVTRGVPRIEADAAGIAQLIAGSGEIIASANLLLSEENTAAFGRILANVETLTTALAAQDEEISATVTNTAKLTANLASTSEKLGRTVDSLDKLLSADAPETLAETQALMAELRGAIAENREQIRVFTDQGLAQVGPAVAEARALFRTLDQVLREIDRDPRGYLLGESTPRYEGEQK